MTSGCPVCGNDSHSSRKVAPFCSTFHRKANADNLRKLDEEKLAAQCAGADEHIEHEGLIHKVKTATMEKKGAAYFTEWTTVCGAHPEYPKAVDKNLTCFGCMAEE